MKSNHKRHKIKIEKSKLKIVEKSLAGYDKMIFERKGRKTRIRYRRRQISRSKYRRRLISRSNYHQRQISRSKISPKATIAKGKYHTVITAEGKYYQPKNMAACIATIFSPK